jgi:hypothetical protein
MDPTPGSSYPFCRECTAATTSVPARYARSGVLGTRYVRWGRRCRRCGSVVRIRFFCYFWIPLIPVSGRYRIIRLRSSRVFVGRRVRTSGVGEDRTMVVARYLEWVEGHPELRDERHALADELWAGGDSTGALVLYQATLDEHEKVLGVDHPASLAVCHQVARAHLELMQVADAIPLLERVFRHRLRVLGPGHPDTAHAFCDFADVTEVVRAKTPLKPVFQRSLTELEQKLGPGHPRTLRARAALGKACVDVGHDDEAVRHLERCLDDSQPGDPDTALVRADLISACTAAHESPNIPHIAEAARVRARILGRDHPDTLASENRLAMGYRETGREAEAVALWKSVQERADAQLASEAARHLRRQR